MQETDEENIISDAISGDKKAWFHIIDKYSEKTYKLIMSFVNNHQHAEDISQDVFIEVFSNISRFRKEASLETWIYRIAINKSINFLNKQRRSQWLNYFSASNDKTVKSNDILNRSTEEHPLHIMLENEKRELLYRAINKLPKNQKIAFTLNKLDDKSYQEVAHIMNLSVSSVESLIHRAKQNLQKNLKKLF